MRERITKFMYSLLENAEYIPYDPSIETLSEYSRKLTYSPEMQAYHAEQNPMIIRALAYIDQIQYDLRNAIKSNNRSELAPFAISIK